jgi:hypothetical protein
MVRLANKQLGTAVPSGSYIIGHFLEVFRNEPCKAKVTKFQYVFVLTEKDVLRLDITVDDVFIVEELEAFYDFVHDLTDEVRLGYLKLTCRPDWSIYIRLSRFCGKYSKIR